MKEKLPPKTGLDFGAMMDDIDREEELKQESTNLEKQIDQLRSVIWTLEEDQVTVVQASADLDDTRELLEKLEGKKFTVQLDDQSIETVKGMHSEFFANEKKLIEESHQKMEKMLSQHREKLKRIKDGENVWLSFKAWVWSIIIFEVSLLLVAHLEQIAAIYEEIML